MTVLGFLVIGLNQGKPPSQELLFSFLVALRGQDALAVNHRELSLLMPSADLATVTPDLRIIGFVRYHIKASTLKAGPSFEYLVA
jgi:hypothetical protein